MRYSPGFEPERYSTWFDTELGRLVWQDEREALLRLVGPVSGRAVLDAGVGEGRFALDLLKRGAQVTGVDAAPSMLQLAHRRGEDAGLSLPLVAGRLEALPFRSASFDLVVAVTVLCVVPDPVHAVGELARVLAPGGRLVIAELGQWSWWAAHRRVRGLLGHNMWRSAHFWTPDSLARVCRANGLDPVEQAAAVFYPPSLAARRLLRPLESCLARRTALGAAFIALAAKKR